jgi:hypothetical protein
LISHFCPGCSQHYWLLVLCPLSSRYNVSCSHHFQVSRGRASARPPGPPVPPDNIVRRRGPRRSSSEIACAKIAGRHLPVKEVKWMFLIHEIEMLLLFTLLLFQVWMSHTQVQWK